MNKYLLNEWYIMVCILGHNFSSGFLLALPSVVAPVITGPNPDFRVSKEQASWYIASCGITGPIGFLLFPGFMQRYGRRAVHVLINFIILLGSIITALAHDITILIIGRAIQGISFVGIILGCIMVAEYTHPKRRGFFTVFKLSSISLGELMCHGLGLCLTWRQLAWISAIPTTLAIIGTLRWPESPAWLAYKGRYEECASAFKEIRGKDLEAKEELRELIAAQREIKKTSGDYENTISAALKAFRHKDFWKPLIVVCLTYTLLQVCGTYYLIAYMIEIMLKLTGDRSKAYYFTIGVDTLKLTGFLLTSFIVRFWKRRSMLFVFGPMALIVLALICVFHYLDVKGLFVLKWLTPMLLILYVFLSQFGIVSIPVLSKGEIIPLRYRGVGTCVSGVVLAIVTTLSLKLTSPMMEQFDLHGMLGIYLIICVILLCCLYFILPETKDRTMQDIENEMVGLKLDKGIGEYELKQILNK